MHRLTVTLSLLPLRALSGCVASVDTVARARAARDLTCPESRLFVAYLHDVGPETVEVSGCDVSARYTCPVSAGAGPAMNQRICIREAEPLKQMMVTEESRRMPAK
jgi:hypothetical protein